MSAVFILLANLWTTISNADICISRDPEGSSNTPFFGNYQLKTDGQSTYYEKDQAFCDDQPEYLYVTNGNWRTHQELGVDNEYYLFCPDEDIASPDLCTAGTWINGNLGTDAAIQVTANACPDTDYDGTLGCDYILLQDSGNADNSIQNGLYTKTDDNLYQKDAYYFQYSKVSQSWIIATSDQRESCNNPSYYFKSTDTAINTLIIGDLNEAIDIEYPVQDGDYSCKQPKISCLNSVPSVEELNDALCNFPCNIDETIPSLSCNYLEIDIQNSNHIADGVYEQVNGEVNLYQMDDTYFFQYYIRGEYYAITLSDDRYLCGNTGPSSYLRSYDSDIDTLANGDSIQASLDYPVGGTATINCLAQAPTSPPTVTPPDGLCVAVTSGWSVNSVPLADIAGTYSLMSTQINGQDAYQLQSECGTAYISYDDVYPYYFLSTNAIDPYPSGWVTYCTNTGSINGDISQCIWSTTLIEVSSFGCVCGQTIGSSAASPMMEPKNIQLKFPDENIGIWSQFMDMLHTEIMSVVLILVLVMMIIWTIIMCGYLFGCNKSNKRYYSPAKVVENEI